jgi:hypothetical protein
MPEGVNDNGLTLTGFLFLHALFVNEGRLETTWTVLRKFGYDNDIKLRDDLIAMLIRRAPDQVMFCLLFDLDQNLSVFNFFYLFLRNILFDVHHCALANIYFVSVLKTFFVLLVHSKVNVELI